MKILNFLKNNKVKVVVFLAIFPVTPTIAILTAIYSSIVY